MEPTYDNRAEAPTFPNPIPRLEALYRWLIEAEILVGGGGRHEIDDPTQQLECLQREQASAIGDHGRQALAALRALAADFTEPHLRRFRAALEQVENALAVRIASHRR